MLVSLFDVVLVFKIVILSQSIRKCIFPVENNS